MSRSWRTVLGAVTVLMMVAAAGAAWSAAPAAGKLPAGQARVAIPVEGMTCQGCTAAISHAVKSLDGVVEVRVDYEGKKTLVTYEKEKVTVKRIVAAINKTGFKATPPATSDGKEGR